MNRGENNMEFTERDLIIFYELHNRINLKSRNIGVLGDSKKFKRIIKDIYKQHKEKGMQVLSVKDDKYIFIINDIEYSYIKIETLQDLRGRYFRKYI